MSTVARPPGRLPARPADGHKGTFGRVLVVAGSRGLSGAAVLCGSAGLRAGAGLVTVACPADIQNVVAAGNPCYTTHAVPTGPGGEFLKESAANVSEVAAACQAIAAGPGLGAEPGTAEFVRSVLLACPRQPCVIDADGLPAVGPGRPAGHAAWVLTPHPGEFGRLLGVPTAQVQADRERLAVGYAQSHNVVLVLKGHHTVITDGTRVAVNPTGNPGMATGGTGDVLTGVVAGFLAGGLPAFDAAVLAVWVHGHAGDLAAAEVGVTALTAADVLGMLPRAVRAVEPAATPPGSP